MKKKNTSFSNPRGGAAIKVQIIPDAENNSVKKISPEGLVILALKADQQTLNSTLREYLSGLFNVSSDQIEIIEGSNHNDRLVCVLDMNVQDVNSALHKAIK